MGRDFRFFLTVITLAGCFAFAETPSVVIKEQVNLSDQEGDLSLSDLIDYKQTSESLIQCLSELKLGNKPALGESRVISARALSKLLRPIKQDVRRKLGSSLVVKIPTRVKVTYSPEFTQINVSEKLVTDWKSLCDSCKFEVSQLSLPILPENFSIWQIQKPTDLPKGTFNYRVIAESDTGESRVFWVSGLMRTFREVPVAKRMIPFGSRLTKEDLEFATTDVTFSNDSTPTLLDELVGKKLTLSVRSGATIWSRMLVRDKLVRRGDIVKVKYGSETFDISMQAQAQQDGYLGDVVSVKNLNSNKVISGRVNESGEVIVQ